MPRRPSALLPPLHLLAGALAALLLSGACIQRPDPMGGRREGFDRQAAAEALASALPTDATLAHSRFDDGVQLEAYRVTPAHPQAGRGAALELYWRVLDPPPAGDWRVFVHVDLRGGGRVGNADHEPAGGRYPSDAWQPGELIRDTVPLPLPPQPGVIDLWVGLYRGGARLPISAGGRLRAASDNRLALKPVSVGAL